MSRKHFSSLFIFLFTIFSLFLCFMLSASLAMSEDVNIKPVPLTLTFEWDTRPKDERVIGYSLFESNISGDVKNETQWHKINKDIINEPPYVYTITEGVHEDRWYYCIAVGENGLKSSPSNVVTTFVNNIPPGKVKTLVISNKRITLDLGE